MGENIFGSYANERKNEQDRIEKSVAPRKHDKRAQFTIAMSAANKKKLKM